MKTKNILLTLLASTSLFAAKDETLFLQPNVLTSTSLHFATQIGCTSIARTTEGCEVAGLQTYLEEIAKNLRSGEESSMISPSNHHILFTAHGHEESAQERINSLLVTLQGASDEAIKEGLMTLTEVYGATFIEKEGQLVLVNNPAMLYVGMPLWRKSEDRVEKGFYHSDIECLSAIAQAGLKCVEVKRPSFFGNVKYKMYHQAAKGQDGLLGAAYIENHPFTIYTFVKE